MTNDRFESDASSSCESLSHVPVMPRQVCDLLLSSRPATIVDCTLGLAGHAQRLLEQSPGLRLLGLDVDEDNLAEARRRLAGCLDRVTLHKASFAHLGSVLADLGIGRVDGILADLGVSSNQIADPSRGLSFDVDGPLDMRLDRSLPITAADLVNGLSEGELADLLYLQSDERASRRISKRICQARRNGRLDSTVALARLVAAAVGRSPDARRSRLHPATRTFLALRRAVNRESETLRALLEQAPSCLAEGGRFVVMSFHSGEDRMVKEDFKARAQAGEYRLLTRKPLTPDDAEQAANPRSRSAKLRAVEFMRTPKAEEAV